MKGMRNLRSSARGFSLVELLLVLTIILVIAAIAIPNYLSAMQRAREAGAIAFLRQVQTAQEAYRLANHEYADTFVKLRPYLTTQAALPVFPTNNPPGVLFALAMPDPSPGVAQGHSGTAPGQSGTPPGQGGTPPGQGGTPPGQGGTPPGQAGAPPSGGGTPTGTTTGGTTYSDSIVQSLYIYRLSRPSALEWQCIVEPLRDRTSGKYFYSDNSNVIRFALGTIPTASSPQI